MFFGSDLMELNDDWVVDLHKAVVVYRNYSGKLSVDREMTTRESAVWGALRGWEEKLQNGKHVSNAVVDCGCSLLKSVCSTKI